MMVSNAGSKVADSGTTDTKKQVQNLGSEAFCAQIWLSLWVHTFPVSILECAAGTTWLEPATSAVTEHR